MGKTYEIKFHGLLVPTSADHLSQDEQLDLVLDRAGDCDGSGTVTAARLGLLSVDLVLNRALEFACQHNRQQKQGEQPLLMLEIEALTRRCIEIAEGKAMPCGTPYPADTLPLLMLQLGASIELANRQEVMKDGAKQLRAIPRRNKPLNDRAVSSQEARARANVIAAGLWQADTAQKIRVGEMADRVYRALADEGFTESLPGTAERIKEWIKAAAPEYARKGGKPRKTP